MRKNPAISHQPPSSSGGNSDRPCLADGGSSDRNGSILMKRITFQSTDAHMFSPMISIATKPQAMDSMPSTPRWVGPTCPSPSRPSQTECRGVIITRGLDPRGGGGPGSNGPTTSIDVNSV